MTLKQMGKLLDAARQLLRYHATKILGFLQVTIGVIALQAEDLFGHHGAKWVLVGSGLLTAWRGFWASQNSAILDKKDDPGSDHSAGP